MDDQRDILSHAQSLAMVIDGPPAGEDQDAIQRAYTRMITLRSLGVEMIGTADLAAALEGMNLCPHDQCQVLAGNIMSRLAQRF